MTQANVGTITPEYARTLLSKSNGNYRPVNKNHVEYLAQEMKAGRWHLTYEAIVIDPKLGVVDGQHRLHAVVRANIAADFLIVKASVSAQAVDAMDSGMNRTAGVVLNARGYKSSARTSAVARVYYQSTIGYMPWDNSSSSKTSVHAIINVCETKPHIHEIVRIVTQEAFRRSGMTRACGSIAMLAHDDSPDHAMAFLAGYSGAERMSNPNHPLRFLYTRMMKNQASVSAKIGMTMRAGWAAKAYNAFVVGQDVGLLRVIPGEHLRLVNASEYS